MLKVKIENTSHPNFEKSLQESRNYLKKRGIDNLGKDHQG